MQKKDILWKGAIEDLFEDFVYFFYPHHAHLIDFERGYEFLDKELAQLFPDAENKQRFIDKLVKVYLLNGEEKWILIHVEVQGYEDLQFEERMFIYMYRIKDRFRMDITALAIFTDKNPRYLPHKYETVFLGTRTLYEFNTYKVIAQKESVLRKSSNPFALIVLSTLIAIKKGKKNDLILFEIKRDLTKLLYSRHYNKKKIQDIFYFINYYIQFADSQNTLIFADEIISTYQPELKNMGIQDLVIMIEKEESLNHGIDLGKEIGIDLGKEIGIDLGKEIGIDLGKEIGIDLGIDFKTTEVILNAHNEGLSLDLIATIVKLPVSKVQEILNNRLKNEN
jgi:predicted transposase YdaD